jgi:peptide/nickel transport system substrate-binding protein
MRRRVPVALVLIGWVYLGCAPADRKADNLQVSTRPQPGGTLVVAASTDIGGVNELLSATGSFTQSVLQLMFLQLFQEQPDFDQHPPTFAPELAERWDWSADHLTLTVHLRHDVYWSNGEPVTAEDVEWTWRAQTHPAVAWAHAESKDNIAVIEALDAHTLRVSFHERSVHQLADLNEGVILPRSVWSQVPFSEWRQSADWFLDHLVTNGPFSLGSWERQQQISLVRNEAFYVPERPFLDAVVFRIVPEKSNQVGHLLAGEAQFVDHVPASEAARVSNRPDLNLISYWARQYNFICWNTTHDLFADQAMRQALTFAIDRQALVDALWFGHARVASSPIPSSVWAHNPAITPLPYNPRAARSIFEDRGWRDTDGDGILDLDGRPLAFELLTNTSSAVRVDAAVMIQEQLRRVGIQVEVKRLEFNTLIELAMAHDFDALLSGWTIDTSLGLDYAFHSESIQDGYNFGGFSNPDVDQLLEAARGLDTPEQQGRSLADLQVILHEQQPYTFLWEPQRLTGVSVRLRDAQPNSLDPFFQIENWWLEPTG